MDHVLVMEHDALMHTIWTMGEVFVCPLHYASFSDAAFVPHVKTLALQLHTWNQVWKTLRDKDHQNQHSLPTTWASPHHR
jgi:hypothetical protein